MKNLAKCYLIHHPKGEFKLYISEVVDNLSVGSFIYYSEADSWSKKQDIEINLNYKRFAGRTERDVYDEGIVWIELNLGDSFQIELSNDSI